MTFIKEHPLTILPQLRQMKRSDCAGEKGTMQWPETFFVHTYHSNVIEEHYAGKKYNPKVWKEWWEDGRLYVRGIVDKDKFKDL